MRILKICQPLPPSDSCSLKIFYAIAITQPDWGPNPMVVLCYQNSPPDSTGGFQAVQKPGGNCRVLQDSCHKWQKIWKVLPVLVHCCQGMGCRQWRRVMRYCEGRIKDVCCGRKGFSQRQPCIPDPISHFAALPDSWLSSNLSNL